MAKKIKDYYDESAAELLAAKITAVYPEFSGTDFVREVVPQLADAVFSRRQDIFATALEGFLPADYAESLSILSSILGPPLDEPEGMFVHGWWLWPVGRYVERNSLRDHALSLSFVHELTRRFTGEFAIRPLLKAEPETTLEVLASWATEDDVHVRRCASEGMRINLPWAKKLTVALDHFDRFRAVLELLKDDPERFVQKSVGNNLNDLMKVAPEKARSIIDDWEIGDPTPQRRWIIRHGSRSVKKT